MAEEFGFFDPVEIAPDEWDREYNADQFTKYFKSLVSTGIMKGAESELKVTAVGSNMITEIATGVAFIEGRYYANTAMLAHTHDTETLGKDRIDRIVVRLDLNERWVKSFIKKGVASANPAPPSLTRNATVYEISLAQVKVIGGQTYISAENVTDERGKPDVCPWAGSKILPNFDAEGLKEVLDEVAALDRFLKNHGIGASNWRTQVNPNDVTETGFYYITSTAGILPHGNAGYLFVQQQSDENANYLLQEYIHYSGVNGRYRRIKNNGVWSDWKRVEEANLGAIRLAKLNTMIVPANSSYYAKWGIPSGAVLPEGVGFDTINGENLRILPGSNIKKIRLVASITFVGTTITNRDCFVYIRRGTTDVAVGATLTAGTDAYVTAVSPILDVTPGETFSVIQYHMGNGNASTSAPQSSAFSLEVIERA